MRIGCEFEQTLPVERIQRAVEIERTVGAQLKPFGIAPIYGDANCDCLVTAADAALVLRTLVGLDTLSAIGADNAKVAGESSVSAQDAALILRYVVKLIERFPVEE